MQLVTKISLLIERLESRGCNASIEKGTLQVVLREADWPNVCSR